MKKKEEGAIHKVLALIMLVWIVICFNIFLQILKVGFLKRYLEDCLTQANLASILVDPYDYGSTGELVFADIHQTRELFEEVFYKSLTEGDVKGKFKISDISITDFRIYEVTKNGTAEFIFDTDRACTETQYGRHEAVYAPDNTLIQSSAVYSQIAVSAEFMMGIKVTVVKEHCVDIVSEEFRYE